jgi:hypothetical protein
MAVSFITNGGELSLPTALTTKGVATNYLTLDDFETEAEAPIYNVVASTALLVASTNVQEACNTAAPLPVAATGAKPSGAATPRSSAAAPTAVVRAATSSAPQIKPPSTGDGGLR